MMCLKLEPQVIQYVKFVLVILMQVSQKNDAAWFCFRVLRQTNLGMGQNLGLVPNRNHNPIMMGMDPFLLFF